MRAQSAEKARQSAAEARPVDSPRASSAARRASARTQFIERCAGLCFEDSQRGGAVVDVVVGGEGAERRRLTKRFSAVLGIGPRCLKGLFLTCDK